MQKDLPVYHSPSIEQSCHEIQRGLLKLLLAFTSHSNDAWNLDLGKATPPAFSVIEIDDWKEALGLWSSVGQPLIADLPARACPACDSSVSHPIFRSYDGYHFSECEQCGTWYVPLIVDWTLFERFFAKCPPARAIAKKATTDRLEQSDNPDFSRFGNYFRSVLDILSPSRSQLRYLDIGCGVGHALTAAKTAGMLPHGVEADADAVALAKRNHEVIVGSVGDLPEGTYDVVSMWETLEHLANPLLMLREAVARLSPGGLVAVTVPNLDATGLRVSREKCSYVYGGFNSPGHISFFNRRTIEMLFMRSGLALVDVTYEFSTDPLELVGYLGGVGAADRAFAMAAPPQPVAEALNLIWPSVMLLEDLAGTLPIMHCIACRLEDVSLFSKKCGERKTIHKERLIAAARDRLVTLKDPFQQLRELTEQHIKMHAHLQAEVDKRDVLLNSHEVHDHLQAEVNKRDTLIKEIHDHLQGEVNKRDAIIAEMQKQLNERPYR